LTAGLVADLALRFRALDGDDFRGAGPRKVRWKNNRLR
jgi:hypothetical protein